MRTTHAVAVVGILLGLLPPLAHCQMDFGMLVGGPSRPTPSEVAQWLGHANRSVRRRGADALFELGPDAGEIKPVIRRALADPDLEVRVIAALCLDQIDPEAPGIVPVLAEAVDEGTSNYLIGIAQALVRREPDRAQAVVTRLTALLASDDFDRRVIAVQALGALGAQAGSAVPLLVPLLGSDNAQIKRNVIGALAAIGQVAAVPALLATLGDHDAQVREDAARALMSIKPVARETAQAVLDSIKSADGQAGNPNIGFSIVDVAAVVTDTVDQLMRMLASDSAIVRSKAAQAVAQLGPKAKAAVPALEAALHDADPLVYCAAASALVAIEKPLSKPAVRELVALVDQRGKNVEALLIRSLAVASDEPEVQVALLKTLERAHDVQVIQEATIALGVDRLHGMLKDQRPEVRKRAIRALGSSFLQFSPARETALPLVHLLTDAEVEVRQLAIEALGSIAQHYAPDLDPFSEEPPPAVPGDRGWVAEQVTPAVAKVLTEPNPALRRAAVGALGMLGPDAEAAVPALAGLATDRDADVRYDAIEALGAIGPKAQAATPALVSALKGKPSRVRAAAADALQLVHAKGPEVRAALIAALADADSATRQAAVKTLAAAGDSGAAAPLLKALDDSDPAVCQVAAIELGKLGAEVAPQVVPALAARFDSELGRSAVEGLLLMGRTAPRVVEQQMLDELKSGEVSVRRLAVEVLSEVGSAAATRPLIRLVVGTETGAEIEVADDLLVQTLAWIGPSATDAVDEILSSNLDHVEWIECFEAVSQILHDIGPAVLPELTKGLGDPNSRRRLIAAWALGGYGEGDVPAVTALARLASDHDRKCRLAAIEALGRIGARSPAAVSALIDLLATAPGNYSSWHPFADDDYSATVVALIVVGRPAVGPLVKALRQPVDRVRHGAIGALAGLTTYALAAVPELERLAGDPREPVRTAALDVLRAMAELDAAVAPQADEPPPYARLRQASKAAQQALERLGEKP